MKEQIRLKLIEFLSEILSQQFNDDLPMETHLAEDLSMDSLSLVSLLFLCEEQFKVDIMPHGDQIKDITTLSEVVDFINKLTSTT
jgi:acyl carrier protein